MRIYWSASPQGRLATSPAPSAAGLRRDVADMAAHGITTVVSTLPEDEANRLGLQEEAALLAEAGVEFLRFPIVDFGVPDDLEAADRFISELTHRLNHGASVLVHCRGGIGRCSTLAASVLCALGQEPEEAMSNVSEARGIRVPETQGQRMWVHSSAARRGGAVA